jgi:DNA ligase-1
MLLAQVYDPLINDPTNWIISEKLDGYRAQWDPVAKKLISKNGLTFEAPDFFIYGVPDIHLDGELWHGRKSFEKVSIARRATGPVGDPDTDEVPTGPTGWSELKFMIFDAPKIPGTYVERLAVIKAITETKYFKVLDTWICTGSEFLNNELKRLTDLGAEGLIIRDPSGLYIDGRSPSVLKVKTYNDAEAIVIGYKKGHGRLEGLVGSLIVKGPVGDPDRVGTFCIGSGLNDQLRTRAPAIGTIVTYRYDGLTNRGLPRCPVFIRVREDPDSDSQGL